MLIVLLLLVVLLVGLVALAPTIASTGWGRRIIARQIDGRIHGQFGIEKLSLSWWGNCTVGDITLRDETGEEVLRVAKVEVPAGLVTLIRSGGKLPEITIDEPHITMVQDRDGGSSLVRALSPTTPSTDESSALPEIQAGLRVRRGKAVLRSPGRPELRIGDLSVDAKADTRGPLSVKLAATLESGGRITADANLSQWITGGAIDPQALNGTVVVRTEQPVDLAPLDDFAQLGAGLAGQLSAEMEAAAQDGRLRVTYSVDARGLRAGGTSGALAEPIDVSAKGNTEYANGRLEGAVGLNGAWGEVHSEFDVPDVARVHAPPIDEVLAALLAGERAALTLPDIKLDSRATVDLAAVARAVPALLRVRDDVRITAGTLTVEPLTLAGGTSPQIALEAKLSGLSAERAGRTITWQPISAALAATSAPNTGLQLDRVRIESEFGAVTATGSPDEISADLHADLAALHAGLTEVFDLPGVDALSGNVTASVNVQRHGDEDLDIVLRGEAGGLRFASGDRRVEIGRAAFQHRGALTVRDGTVTQIVSDETSVALDDRVSIQAQGRLDPRDSSFDARMTVAQADLAYVAMLAESAGEAVPHALTGLVQGELNVQGGTGKTLRTAGSLTARNLTIDGQSAGALAECGWTEVSYTPDTASFAASAVNVKSDPLQLAASNVSGGAGASGGFSGGVTFTADLASLSDLARAFGIEISQTASGKLRGDLTAARTPGDATIRSNGRITADGLTVDGRSLGDKAKCEWTDASYAPDSGRISAARLDLDSKPLEIKAKNIRGATGEDDEFAGDVQVKADLAALGTAFIAAGVLAEAPGVAGTLTANGALASAGGAIDLNGQADVRDLVIPGENAWAPRAAKLNYAARIEPDHQTLRLEKLKLDSDLATTDFSGTVRDLSGARAVDIQGNYRCDWGRVLPVLYAFAPTLREQISASGVSQGPVRITGNLSAAEGTSPLAGLSADTSGGWDSADVFGVALGKTKLEPKLTDGLLTLPPGPIPTASGTVRVGGSVDLTQSPPLLAIPGELALLDGVQVTPELARSLLSRFNPLFSRATAISGSAGLVVRDLELPLGAAVQHGGSGGGTLTLDAFQIAPDGIFAELLALGNLAREMYVVEVSGLQFRVKDGRIHYRDLTMRFVQDKFDLKFYGSVGFDDTVDLVVSIPVGEKVLERVGMRTGTADYARLLAGLRVDVPMVGTRGNPRLDFNQVNVKGLLDQAVRKQGEDLVTGGGILDLINQIGGKNNEKTEDEKPAKEEPKRPRIKVERKKKKPK